MFGREPRIPIQNMLPTEQVNVIGWKPNMKAHWKETQEKLFKMHKMRDERMLQYQKAFNPTCSKRLEPLQPGDWVLKRLPRENRHKLSLHWDGPLQVKKRLPKIQGETEKGNVYVITDTEGKEHIRSMFDLKRYSFADSKPKTTPPVPDDVEGASR